MADQANRLSRPIRIMASGVFDLLHPGHIFYLEQAKQLGDELVVVVANDTVAKQSKPNLIFSANDRKRMVAALAVVDKVVVPRETDPKRYYRTVLDINPRIIVLGYNQTFTEQKLLDELVDYGWKGQVVRAEQYPEEEISSTIVKNKVRS